MKTFLEENHQISNLPWIKEVLVQSTNSERKMKYQLVLKQEKIQC